MQSLITFKKLNNSVKFKFFLFIKVLRLYILYKTLLKINIILLFIKFIFQDLFFL